MILTEAEAAVRWCPFSRVAFVGQVATNRLSTHHMQLAQQAADRGDGRDLRYYDQQRADTCCIASKCMAWRWAEEPTSDRSRGHCGLVPIVDTRI